MPFKLNQYNRRFSTSTGNHLVGRPNVFGIYRQHRRILTLPSISTKAISHEDTSTFRLRSSVVWLFRIEGDLLGERCPQDTTCLARTSHIIVVQYAWVTRCITYDGDDVESHICSGEKSWNR